MPRPSAGRPLPVPLFAVGVLLAAAVAGTAFGPASAAAQEDDEASNPILVEPDTAAAQIRTADRLRRIGRPNLAKRYLRALLDSNPDDDTLLAARDAVGPAVFLSLAGDEALRPEAATLLERSDEAFARRAADPARLDGLIDNLVGPPRDRAAAGESLRRLSDIAAPRMTERLAAAADPRSGAGDLRDALVRALGRAGGAAVPPLTAVVRSPAASPAARAAAASALGLTREPEAQYPLLRPAFDPNEAPGVRLAALGGLGDVLGLPPSRVNGLVEPVAARTLAARAENLLNQPAGVTRLGDDDAAAPRLFRYDAAENRLIAATVSPQAAAAYEAAKLSAAAAALAPERVDALPTQLAAALAYEAALKGRGVFLDRGPGTVHRAALSRGPAAVSAALARALDLRADGAAAAALQVLLDAPGRDLLRRTPSGPAPVLRALESPAPEVRFLAALVIARSDPDPGFVAGPTVVDVLAGALADRAGGRAVVADPYADRAVELAGLLQGLGYRVDLATTGREAFERTAAGSGADLLMVNVNVSNVPLSTLLASVRADGRTAGVPVVLYGDGRLANELNRVANRTGKAIFVPYPTVPEVLQRRIGEIIDRREPLPDALKADQRRAAAFELANLADADPRTFPLRRAAGPLAEALTDPGTAPDAAAALAAVPTATAQDALASLLTVVQPGGESSIAAANALARSVRRFGTLLDAETVGRLQALPAEVQDESLRESLLTLAAALPGRIDPLPVIVELPR